MSSQLYQTATSFLAAFKDLSTDDQIALRAPNCMYIFAPSTLSSYLAQSEMSNENFIQHFTTVKSVLVQFPVTAKEIHVNEVGRQAVIWATAVPEFKAEAKGKDVVEKEWEYMGEYIFILDVDEDGKIVRIVEFLDSLATSRMFELVKKAKENLAAIESS